MANNNKFFNDLIGHIFKDKTLIVPNFQRCYAWDDENVKDYWNDIYTAWRENSDCFLGTVVLADVDTGDEAKPGRQSIVDGQQRITTTALLILAIIAGFTAKNKSNLAAKAWSERVASLDMYTEQILPKLTLNQQDNQAYSELIDLVNPDSFNKAELQHYIDGINPKEKQLLKQSFAFLMAQIDCLSVDDLKSLVGFLDTKVQILLAVASNLSEAYIIFETLNDRGAALTATDLLKNYLFSVSKERLSEAEYIWTQVSSKFEKPDDFAAFVRYHYISKWEKVQKKDLYKKIQSKVKSPSEVIKYLNELNESTDLFMALRSPDDQYWNSIDFDLRNDIIAHSRLRLEAPFAIYLAAFTHLKKKSACKLISSCTRWWVRAAIAKNLGGGSAERLFSDICSGINAGKIKSAEDCWPLVERSNLVPNDDQFASLVPMAFNNQLPKQKYLLAMMEITSAKEEGVNTEVPLQWDSKGVTIEHIVARSTDFTSSKERSSAEKWLNCLPNFTLLEKSLNQRAGNKPFSEKSGSYSDSAFILTRQLAEMQEFGNKQLEERATRLATLACRTWPL